MEGNDIVWNLSGTAGQGLQPANHLHTRAKYIQQLATFFGFHLSMAT